MIPNVLLPDLLGSGRGHHLSESSHTGEILGGASTGHSHSTGRASPKVSVRSSHVTTVAIQEDRTDVVR